VPLEVRDWVIRIDDSSARPEFAMATYPAADATRVYRDAVVKVFVSEPCTGLDPSTFTLSDRQGAAIPASVDQIGAGTWALFPHRVFLEPDELYTAHVEARLCGFDGHCRSITRTWRFTTAAAGAPGAGDTRVPLGFIRPSADRDRGSSLDRSTQGGIAWHR
jgi:hypothetical protein